VDVAGRHGRRDRGRVRISAQYNVATPNSLPARVTRYQRRKMFRAFMDFAAVAPGDTILDIGATSDRLYDHSNYFEAWYQCKRSVTAVGLDDAAFLAQQYLQPGPWSRPTPLRPCRIRVAGLYRAHRPGGAGLPVARTRAAASSMGRVRHAKLSQFFAGASARLFLVSCSLSSSIL
jgi:hypothetical protein